MSPYLPFKQSNEDRRVAQSTRVALRAELLTLLRHCNTLIEQLKTFKAGPKGLILGITSDAPVYDEHIGAIGVLSALEAHSITLAYAAFRSAVKVVRAMQEVPSKEGMLSIPAGKIERATAVYEKWRDFIQIALVRIDEHLPPKMLAELKKPIDEKLAESSNDIEISKADPA